MTFPASFYFHEILSPEKTEELLNEDQSYLVRRSPLDPDRFILSYLVDKRIKHEIVENGTCTCPAGQSVKNGACTGKCHVFSHW